MSGRHSDPFVWGRRGVTHCGRSHGRDPSLNTELASRKWQSFHVARRKIVSEKTLELNLCATFLDRIRTTWPGCSGAFWIGMKQYQEAGNGIDELLHNVPSARHLALQFKAPSPRQLNVEPYRYGLGEDQNAKLQLLAASRPDSVLYVLPNYNTFTRLHADSPNLDAHTYLLPVAATAGLGCVVGGKSRHRADCWEAPPRAKLHSEPLEALLVSAKQFLTSFSEEHESEPKSALLTNAEMLSWVTQTLRLGDSTPASVGQLLRGFATVCVP